MQLKLPSLDRLGHSADATLLDLARVYLSQITDKWFAISTLCSTVAVEERTTTSWTVSVVGMHGPLLPFYAGESIGQAALVLLWHLYVLTARRGPLSPKYTDIAQDMHDALCELDLLPSAQDEQEFVTYLDELQTWTGENRWTRSPRAIGWHFSWDSVTGRKGLFVVTSLDPVEGAFIGTDTTVTFKLPDTCWLLELGEVLPPAPAIPTDIVAKMKQILGD